MFYLFLFNLIFSAYDFSSLKDVKIIDKYEGTSSYTLVLVNSGAFYEDISSKLNYELFNTTETLVKNANIDTIFFSAFNNEQYNFYVLKQDLEELYRLSENFTKKEIRKMSKELNKELRKTKKIIKKNNCDTNKDYREYLNNLIENINVFKNIINNDYKKLAKNFNYVELIQYSNLNKNLDFINIEFTEDKYIIEYIVQSLYLINEFDVELENLYKILKEFSNLKLSYKADLYRNSEIDSKQFAFYETINKKELTLIDTISNNSKVLDKDDLLNIFHVYLVNASENLLNSFINQIKNYKNIESKKYIQLFVNSLFIGPGNKSLPSLLKENNISFVILSTKSNSYLNFKILDDFCFLE